jgi:hypothetical protein
LTSALADAASRERVGAKRWTDPRLAILEADSLRAQVALVTEADPCRTVRRLQSEQVLASIVGAVQLNIPVTEETGPTDAHFKMIWERNLCPDIERLMARVDDLNDFQVHPRSWLGEDDAWADPFQVSHAVKQCLVSAVDHLHACKVLVADAGAMHLAAPGSLVRGSVGSAAAAFWMLHPKDRAIRVTRALRWRAKDVHDDYVALSGINPDADEKRAAQTERLAEVAARHSEIDAGVLSKGLNSTAMIEYADQNTRDDLKVLLMWRLCSGFAHGRQWAALAWGLRETFPTSDPDVLSVKFTNDLTRVVMMTLTATHLIKEVEELHARRARW